MTIDSTPAPLSAEPVRPIDTGELNLDLHLGMRVIGDKRKALGTLDTLVRDPGTGRLTALAVRHGLYNQRLTVVPADRLDHVEQGIGVLRITKAAFMQLPRVPPDC